MPSKGQGLSLNAIVIAGLALVVLIILVLMMTGYFPGWSSKFSTVTETSCKGQGGEEKTTCATGERESFTAEVKTPGNKCCVKPAAATPSCGGNKERCCNGNCNSADLECKSGDICEKKA